MILTITPLADVGVDVLPPDIIWNGTTGDFAVSIDPADGGVGGLVARNPIQTAVLMLLFTDAQADVTTLRYEHKGDRRGWVGDGFDIDAASGEAPLGSRLWLYRRSALVDMTAVEIEAEIRRALRPLLGQGAAARIDVAVTVDKAGGLVTSDIAVIGRDGRTSYAARFDPLWRRANGL